MNLHHIILSLALLLSTLWVSGQKKFEGELDYAITYIDLPENMKGHEAMLPKVLKMQLKNKKARMSQESAMGNTAIILDYTNHKMYTLMEIMGQKVALSDELKDDEVNKQDITFVSEQKQIAGFLCKKAIVQIENNEVAVFYTEEYIVEAHNPNTPFKKLKGMPMEYTMENKGVKMTMTATAVTEKEIAATQFEIPHDYQKITSEDFLQMMMQGGQ